MSMHEMEALVECSVRVLAAARPIPADARNLCHSLYELQNQFDCGYTILRVPEELERLGYLRRLPPERLPEPERSEALALSGENGFLGESPKTYFHAQSGLACVTAGSPLWEKLCRSGILSGADAEPVREVPILDMAERIADLASAQSDDNAAEAKGLWYILFPAFVMMDSDDEDEEPSPRMLALRDRLAAPQALAAAAEWGRLPDPEALGACDIFEERWLEPYVAWGAGQRETQKQRDPANDKLDRALKSLGHYQQLVAEGKELTPAEGLLSPEETRDVYKSLVASLTAGDTSYSYANLALTACHAMLGSYGEAFGTLWDAYAPAVKKLESESDLWKRRFTTAMLGTTFYRTLAENIPDGAPEKQPLLERRVDGLPTIAEARKIFTSLLDERPGEAWNCRLQIGLCLLDEGDLAGARREFEQAERLQPGNPEIRAALERVDELRGRSR